MIEPRAIAIELPGCRRRAKLSLVPIIDVTLILVFFFMLVIQIGHDRPAGVVFSNAHFNALADPDDEQASGIAPLTLTLGADGAISLWDRRRIAIGELSGVLQERLGSIVLAGETTPPITVIPEPDVPLHMLIEVMRVAQGNSFFKTHIIAPRLAAEVIGK